MREVIKGRKGRGGKKERERKGGKPAIVFCLFVSLSVFLSVSLPPSHLIDGRQFGGEGWEKREKREEKRWEKKEGVGEEGRREEKREVIEEIFFSFFLGEEEKEREKKKNAKKEK